VISSADVNGAMGAEAETMKALTFSKYAGKAPVESVLSVMSVPKPTATPKGFVMVKVVAAALNPIDKLRIKGDIKLLNPEPEFPAVVGYDLSGTIVEVGEEVAGFEVGNEVVARMQSKPMPGSIAEYALVKAKTVALKPAEVSFGDGASLGLAGQTALQALRKLGVTEGSKVFISGGAGGVGTLAIQIAKLLGAGTVATTASAGEKTELCKALGADVVVNYHEEHFEEVIKGYDVAFDTTHEADKCAQVVTPNTGLVVSIAGTPTVEAITEAAAANGGAPPGALVKCFLTLAKDKKVFSAAAKAGITYKYMFLSPNGEDMATLLSWVKEGKLKPVIDSTHPMDQAVEAAKRNFSGHAKGKVVVTVSDESPAPTGDAVDVGLS